MSWPKPGRGPLNAHLKGSPAFLRNSGHSSLVTRTGECPGRDITDNSLIFNVLVTRVTPKREFGMKKTMVALSLGLCAVSAQAELLSLSGGDIIADRYIVVLEDDADGVLDIANALTGAYGGDYDLVYEHALSGFAVEMTHLQALTMAADPRVRYIEPDQTMVQFQQTQEDATWGLDRIDQRDLPLDGLYTFDSDGSGVHVYIIDSGLNTSHQEFAGRVGDGHNTVPDSGLLLGEQDCNGHGTHVAGTASGSVYGVAKGSTVYGVRVFSCAPTTMNSFVLAGIDWVTENHQSPAVANMSLGGGASEATDKAVRNSIEAGVFYAVAAGNDDADACDTSPARVAEAMTVGSTTAQDDRSSFSNFGDCVDIFAPGSDITAAGFIGTTGTQTLSGTSMASPHVAGAAALVLDGNPQASPAEVFDALIDKATQGRLIDVGEGSPNRLLYSREQ